MNNIVRNMMAVLLLLLGGTPALYAQESTSPLPRLFEISNAAEWTSPLLEFDEPVDGFRLTVFRTSHSDRLYEGYPYVCLAGIDIKDAEGNDVPYVASTNSLSSDGGGLEALQDKDDNTHYHSAYSGNVSISNNDYVYIEIAFAKPQTSFTYRQVRRAEGYDFPLYFALAPLGVEVNPPFNPVNPPEPEENIYYNVTVTANPEAAAYMYGSGKYLKGSTMTVQYSLRNSNYTFLHWTVNGEFYSDKSYFTYTVNNDDKIVAHFKYTPSSPQEPNAKDEHRLFVESDRYGACSFNVTSGMWVEYDNYVYLTAYVNQGYDFLGWYRNGVLVSDRTSFNYQMPGEDVTLVAKFKYNPYNPSEPESDGSQDNVQITPTGDINKDGEVDVLDIVAVVNYSLKEADDDLHWYDLNGDGAVDVIDIVKVVNLSLE